MNFLIMPMFFLSGAMFPIHNLPLWMKLMARIDPMAYGVDALKGVLIGANEMGIGQDIVVLAVFCMLAICIAVFCLIKKDRVRLPAGKERGNRSCPGNRLFLF